MCDFAERIKGDIKRYISLLLLVALAAAGFSAEGVKTADFFGMFLTLDAYAAQVQAADAPRDSAEAAEADSAWSQLPLQAGLIKPVTEQAIQYTDDGTVAYATEAALRLAEEENDNTSADFIFRTIFSTSDTGAQATGSDYALLSTDVRHCGRSAIISYIQRQDGDK